ncbi:MAG TPA: TlpA disulfide reductase family protein [Bacillota bacterium]
MNKPRSRTVWLGAVILAVLGVGLGLWRWSTADAPVVGRRAPDFNLQLLQGGTVNLAQFRGRPVLLNFWASWCPPCVEEMPALQQVAGEGRAAVLAVNVGESGSEAAAFLRRHDIDLPVALDGQGELITRYRVAGLPQTFFIDADGVIRHVERGAMTYQEILTILTRMERKGA